MSDYSELKRLAEAATQGKWSVGAFGGVNGHGHTIITNIAMEGCDLIAQITHDGHDAPDFDYIAAARPEVVLALIAESEAIKAQFDECARLFVDATEQACKAQRERDQLKDENEALRNGIDPAWSLMDQSLLIDHLRLNTNFAADKVGAMIQFAVECAQYVELNPSQGDKSGG